MNTKLFRKYEWLVNTLIKTGGLTLKEINERYKANENLSGGLDLPPTTFHRWRDGIFNAFAVIIECNRSGNKYFVSNKNELEFTSMKKWMFQVMSFGNFLVYDLGLHKRIIMDPLSFATGVMDGIVKAMLHFKMAEFGYEGINNRQMVAPYYIKMHYQKAYLLGRLEDSDFKWYNLEKICDVKILDTDFKMDDNPELLEKELLTLPK
jgi:hypothetical protein